MHDETQWGAANPPHEYGMETECLMHRRDVMEQISMRLGIAEKNTTLVLIEYKQRLEQAKGEAGDRMHRVLASGIPEQHRILQIRAHYRRHLQPLPPNRLRRLVEQRLAETGIG